MSKVDEYRQILRERDDWEEYLLSESGLPGPRGNIELAQAMTEEGGAEWFEYLLTFNASIAPVNTPHEFLAFCGALGQGKLLEEGNRKALETLRRCASDPRWRIREAVAMALHRFGRSNMEAMLDEMDKWSQGSLLERRAAAAGPCHPDLLTEPQHAIRVLALLDQITASIKAEPNRRSPEYIALRKALGYCWSVAAAALPEFGKSLMEKWMDADDPDVDWIMKQNLKKNRLVKVDPAWSERWQRFYG